MRCDGERFVCEMLRLSIRLMVEAFSITIKLIAVGEVYGWKTTLAIKSGNWNGEEVPHRQLLLLRVEVVMEKDLSEDKPCSRDWWM